jgi:carboxyl-terminal processing protease
MKSRSYVPTYLCLITLVLTACATKPIPTQPPQPPEEYLSNALDWIETHSLKLNTVDWPAVRAQALAMAPHPQTTADTYPALQFAVTQLGDSITFFSTASQVKKPLTEFGFDAFYPQAVLISIRPGGPAQRAGLRVGDVIETIKGAPPKPYLGTPFLNFYDDSTIDITIRRAGQDQPIAVTLDEVPYVPPEPGGRRITMNQVNLGYVELPTTFGWELYPTLAQRIIREVDQAGTCGWILDFRRNYTGDLWSYIAAMGPVLGEGEVGGFVYLDGTRDSWRYLEGKVFWGRNERDEDLVEGQIYEVKHPMLPVALLTSHATMAAGELAVIAFQGRPDVRIFGETTAGNPFLAFSTGFSDGAVIQVSSAFSMDRTGRIYKDSIEPDQPVSTDWKKFGTENDPVITAAQNWLLEQPACGQK